MLHRWLVACAITLACIRRVGAKLADPTGADHRAGDCRQRHRHHRAHHRRQLASMLGQTVVVENRTGAGGTTGMGYVAKSASPTATPSWCIPRPS